MSGPPARAPTMVISTDLALFRLGSRKWKAEPLPGGQTWGMGADPGPPWGRSPQPVVQETLRTPRALLRAMRPPGFRHLFRKTEKRSAQALHLKSPQWAVHSAAVGDRDKLDRRGALGAHSRPRRRGRETAANLQVHKTSHRVGPAHSRGGDATHRALLATTKHPLGAEGGGKSARGWRPWWQKASSSLSIVTALRTPGWRRRCSALNEKTQHAKTGGGS